MTGPSLPSVPDGLSNKHYDADLSGTRADLELEIKRLRRQLAAKETDALQLRQRFEQLCEQNPDATDEEKFGFAYDLGSVHAANECLKKINVDEFMLSLVAQGRCEVLQWAYSNYIAKWSGKLAGQALLSTCETGSLELLEWLYNVVCSSTEVRSNLEDAGNLLNTAARSRNYHLLDWLIENRPEVSCTSEMIMGAIATEDLQLLQWIFDNSPRGVWKDMRARGSNNLPRRALCSLFYLGQNSCCVSPTDSTKCQTHGYTFPIDFLAVSETTIEAEARQPIECLSICVLEAVDKGSLEMVRFLLDNDAPGVDKKDNKQMGPLVGRALVQAAEAGQSSLVSFLLDRKPKMEPTKSPDAVFGDEAMVLYLKHIRADEYVIDSLKAAGGRGDSEIVALLMTHRD